jgi:hypothetical protein
VTCVAFGSHAVGEQSALQTVTLTNGGNAPVTNSSIALTGANASFFLTSNACGAGLAAGAKFNLNLHFNP